MTNPMQIPSERGPTDANFTPQGGAPPLPAVTLPPDSVSPPINPKLTDLSPSRMVDAARQRVGKDKAGEDSARPESLEDFLSTSSRLFAQALTMDPGILRSILNVGKAMLKEGNAGGTGQLDQAAVVRTSPERSMTTRPSTGPSRPPSMAPQLPMNKPPVAMPGRELPPPPSAGAAPPADPRQALLQHLKQRQA